VSKALDIALAIGGRLAAITGNDPYQTTIGHRVMQGRRQIDKGRVPCVVVMESEGSVESKQVSPKLRMKQGYTIEGFVQCDDLDNPNLSAHRVIADIKRAIFGVEEERALGGLAVGIEYVGRAIGVREDGADIVSGVVEIDVEFVEDLRSP
jgi:hypothetical protein